MKNKRPYLLAKALMATSLLLLGLFLMWFLYRTYREEETALNRESGYLFVNAIRDIEGGLVNRLVFKKGFNWQQDSLHVPPLPKGIRTDSMHILTIIKSEEDEVLTEDKKLMIRMRSEGAASPPASELSGSISMIFAMSDDSLFLDSNYLHADIARLLPRLQSEYSQSLQRAGLPVTVAITRQKMQDDTLSTKHRMLSGTYTDLASGERFDAELTGYEGYILKKMWPQFLFAFLLFGCIALAFFTVFRMLDAQYKLAALKNEFIQNISHELKTPIATMGVALEAIQGFKVMDKPEKTLEYLDIAQLELKRLSLLVEKVLGLTAFEQSKPMLQMAELDLKELAGEVIAACQLQVAKQQSQITLETEGNVFHLSADRLHLSGVLFNLIDNALKYGGEGVEIKVKVQSAKDKLLLVVSDNGPGIPAAYQDRIFEQFFRAPSTDGHLVKGHGLGLSYAAGVVHRHGGSIYLQNTPGGGATFVVELPIPHHG